MKLLLDDARLDQIGHAVATYPLAGVTTNPTILKDARPTLPFYDHLRAIRQAIGPQRSLHVQVVARDTAGMLAEAERVIAALGSANTYAKVPVTEAGLAAINELKRRGVGVTATAIYTTMQGLLAVAAGADYLAVYVNRMQNIDIDPYVAIDAIRTDIDREGSGSQILAASFKNASQVTEAVRAGAHAVTVSPEIIAQALGFGEVSHAVDKFASDWKTTFGTDTLP